MIFARKRKPSKKIILNLDDEPDITELVEVTLAYHEKEMGFEYELLTFNRPVKALEALKGRKQLDLALINLMMPELDGFEVALRVKKMFPKCKIIMTSASWIREEELKRVGADEYMALPFEPSKLRVRIKELLRV